MVTTKLASVLKKKDKINSVFVAKTNSIKNRYKINMNYYQLFIWNILN